MNDKLFVILVLTVMLGGGYIISQKNTEEDKIKNYHFMMRHMK